MLLKVCSWLVKGCDGIIRFVLGIMTGTDLLWVTSCYKKYKMTTDNCCVPSPPPSPSPPPPFPSPLNPSPPSPSPPPPTHSFLPCSPVGVVESSHS